ncbi:MAG: elongation factor P hydroxylase [Candidatus Azotimanducaceae bacterium]
MKVDDLMHHFNTDLGVSYGVRLIGGGQEPFYQAPKNGNPGRIIFREDFIASALHEVAHWCLAGSRRRCLDDYGYWYVEHRTHKEQLAFEQAEARPQGLACLFSEAIGLSFVVSSDDPTRLPSQRFVSSVFDARDELETQLPPRAERFIRRLTTTPCLNTGRASQRSAGFEN